MYSYNESPNVPLAELKACPGCGDCQECGGQTCCAFEAARAAV